MPEHIQVGQRVPDFRIETYDTVRRDFGEFALRSAMDAGLAVPEEAVARTRVLLRNTLREQGGSAYTVSTKQATPAMTVIGILRCQGR